MTDRIRHLTITRDDYRDDDAQAIVQTLRMIRGVAAVETHVVSAQDYIARETVRTEVERDLHAAIGRVFAHKSFERSVAERREKDRS